MNIRIRRAIFALLLYAVFCAIAGILVAEMTLHPRRRVLDARNIAEGGQVARRTGSTLHDISIRTGDNLLLKAWLIEPRPSNGSAVLLLHGLGDDRLGMLGYAELLLDQGYSVLLPDARAHGQSDGAIATYGLLERQDIRDWARLLSADVHPKCIFGLGESMGAAQLLQALGADPLFCAVAAESSFSDFREIGYDRVGQFFHTGPWLGRTLLRPVIEIAFLYSRWNYGFNLEQVSPIASVAATKTPVLLIHGQVDSNIPVRHSRRIKSAVPSEVLWEVPDADHCGAISVAPEEFKRRLLNWFGAHEESAYEPTTTSKP
jgi:uncharacterized protein